MECIMAVDVGTQSVKAGIVDAGMNVLERSQVMVSAGVRNGSWVEMDAEAVWRALAEACSGLKRGKDAAAIEAVGEDIFLGISGNLPVPGGISVTSLLWVKDNHPDIYAREDVIFGNIGTFLVYR
jgi:sugar (pentulose or hexulose) kinase